ncbi:MAG: cupin domain-containing protein [Desulfobacter sp.]|nr:MAG: cupin domain-containing protein [Desulfobacter sp.]
MANGTVHYVAGQVNIADVPWLKHPQFDGVYLKHLIKGDETCGIFSSHIVKIDPNQCLKTHCHKDQVELHEVLDGSGIYGIAGQEHDYHPGKIALIPKGEDHMVLAGENGLILLAKFFPALI